MVSVGRSIDSPPTHTFYALLIASFLFCFAYPQVLSAFNIRRYLLTVGVVIIGRIFNFLVLYAYMLFVDNFPNTFWITGIIDLAWSALYIMFALLGDEIRVKDLFLPYRESS